MKYEKWQFIPDHECPYCLEEIMDDSVKDDKVVTGCPYCHRSFCD